MQTRWLAATLLVATWPGIAAGEIPVRPGTPYAETARQQARLPGNRPGRLREPLAMTAIGAPSAVAAELPAPALLNGGDPSASAGNRGCEPALRLPWGPIDDCRKAVVASAVGATAAVSLLAWWKQGFHGDFSVADEGWFGAGTNAGGIDKLGHAWSFYVGTRLGARALGWAQLPHDDAIRLAAGVALGVGLGVEVLDGLSRGGQYGFSWQDMAMNVVGVGSGVLMETRPELDRHLAFRLMYRGGDEWYDSHLYLLAWRVSGLSGIGRDNPLRYLELLIGYGARGFRSDLDYSAGDTRRRSVYIGVGLNVTELLDRWVFPGSRGGRAQRWTEEALRYIQVPGTAAARSWQKRP